MGTIDLHSHWMSPDLPDLAARQGDDRWPLLVPGSESGEIRCGANLFRTVSRSCWDVEDRLAEMNKLGIQAQAVLPVPVTLTYWADPDAALELARAQNDRLAEAVAPARGRLVPFASVPLQDPRRATVELERAVVELGMAGVEIGAEISGRELDDPALRPFFRRAAELGARVFIHPLEGGGAFPRCADPLRAFGVGMLTDTALAATALVFGGVLRELPELTVCLAHGGGSFAWSYPRLRFRALIGLSGADAAGERAELDAATRRLAVDSLVLDEAHLPLLLHRFGAANVVLGSDYPFVPWEAGGDGIVGRALEAARCTAEEGAAILGLNGARLLGLGTAA